MAPWAILPLTPTSTRRAPFCSTQIRFSSGSQITAASTPSACPPRTQALIPAILPPSPPPAAQGALLLDADPVLFGLADRGRVHAFGVPAPDESLDPGHHPLLVHRMTENQPSGKRDA